jgi:hypothetical protein
MDLKCEYTGWGMIDQYRRHGTRQTHLLFDRVTDESGIRLSNEHSYAKSGCSEFLLEIEFRFHEEGSICVSQEHATERIFQCYSMGPCDPRQTSLDLRMLL